MRNILNLFCSAYVTLIKRYLNCYLLCYAVPEYQRLYVLLQTALKFYRHLYSYSTVLCFTGNVTLLLRLNDEFDGIWASCGLRRRFRRGYGDFGFYDQNGLVPTRSY